MIRFSFVFISQQFICSVLASSAALLCCASLPAQDEPPTYSHRLVLLDGESASASVTEVSAEGAVSGENVPENLTLDGLRRIERVDASPVVEGGADSAIVVDLIGGGQAACRNVTIADEKASVSWSLGNDLVLPIDALRAIRFQPREKRAAFQTALQTPSVDFDRIFVTIESENGDVTLQMVTGLITHLTNDRLSFEREGEEQTLPRSRVYGVVVAQLTSKPKKPKCLAKLADGSILPAEGASLSEGKLTLRLSDSVEMTVPWPSVLRMDIRSSRLEFLSDMTPNEVEQTPLVTLARPHQNDRSVAGRPLTLGGKVYEKGLGVHSRSRLTYEAGDFDTFAAVIGVDDETQGRGDCIFKVLGDGETLFVERVRGGEEPRKIQVDLKGAERVALLVEPGEELDLADHANWCDARLIRN